MRLKEYRNAAGIAQSELAIRAGVSQQLISHLENGLRDPQAVGLARARAIVAVLNAAGAACTLDDVFGPAPEPAGRAA